MVGSALLYGVLTNLNDIRKTGARNLIEWLEGNNGESRLTESIMHGEGP